MDYPVNLQYDGFDEDVFERNRFISEETIHTTAEATIDSDDTKHGANKPESTAKNDNRNVYNDVVLEVQKTAILLMQILVRFL